MKPGTSWSPEGLTDQLLKQRRIEAFHGVEAHPTIADMDL
jgi:hypothetical protein